MHSRQASRLKIEWWQKRLLLIKKINGKNRMDLTSRDPCSRDVTVTNCPLRSPQAWHWECRLRIFDSSPAAWGWPLDPRGPLSPAAQDGERCPFGGRRGRVGTVGPENKSLKISFFSSPRSRRNCCFSSEKGFLFIYTLLCQENASTQPQMPDSIICSTTCTIRYWT